MKRCLPACLVSGAAVVPLPALRAQTPPDTVKIGAFVNDIYDINLNEKSFSIQFWVWFNYRKSELEAAGNAGSRQGGGFQPRF